MQKKGSIFPHSTELVIYDNCEAYKLIMQQANFTPYLLYVRPICDLSYLYDLYFITSSLKLIHKFKVLH